MIAVILFFIYKCSVMSSRFPMSGRRYRKWLSIKLLTLYPHGWVYEVYRLPVINNEVAYHLFWLHKVLPAS